MFSRRPLSPSSLNYGYHLPPRTHWELGPSINIHHQRRFGEFNVRERPPYGYRFPPRNTNTIPHSLCPLNPPSFTEPGYPFPSSPAELDATTPFHTPLSPPTSSQTNSTTSTGSPVQTQAPQSSRPHYLPHAPESYRTPDTDISQLITEIGNTIQTLISQFDHITNHLSPTDHVHSHGSGSGSGNDRPTRLQDFQKLISTRHPYLTPYFPSLSTDPTLLPAPPGQKRCRLGQPQIRAKCPLKADDGDDMQREICNKHKEEGFLQMERWYETHRRGQFRAWECVDGRGNGDDKRREKEKGEGQKGGDEKRAPKERQKGK